MGRVGSGSGTGLAGFRVQMVIPEPDPFTYWKLLNARGFNLQLPIILSTSQSPQDILKLLLQPARITYMDQDELYFAGINGCHPDDVYSPRNEMESLNLILSLIDVSLVRATHKKMVFLKELRNATTYMLTKIGEQNETKQIPHKCNCQTEEILLQWGKDHGFKTKLQIAHVEGAGRGLTAVEDLEAGDTALEIPESIIISEEVVYESDMFHILKERDDISPETMLLLWSMKERFNSESKYKIFFQALPETFNTGLSFGVEALTALEGTLLFEEIIQAKEHLRMQYDALCPPLCNDHPDIFQPNIYSWERFLWACELWYSNSMKVLLTDGKTNTCLVPIANLLNHSVCPHIVHYGKVDPGTRSMKFSLSRPCRRGEECYLSYGKYSSCHLITFYGFLPKGENVYDIIPLDIDAPPRPEPQDEDSSESEWTSHMVRGTWLSSNHKPGYYGLPPPLLTYLRATLDGSCKMPREGTYIDVENEMAVLETLCSIFSPMLEGLVCDAPTSPRRGEKVGWDVKLALQYKELQRRILSSVLTSCSAGMQMLQS
ncbi:[histone H3]-lysine(4) N-trimethyltransferase [Ranunculus cassubicifolius]